MIKHQPKSELGFLDFVVTSGVLGILRQVLGKQRRHSMGTAVYDPSVVTYITSERTGSTTWPSKRRVSGRALHGHQTYAKLTALQSV